MAASSRVRGARDHGAYVIGVGGRDDYLIFALYC